MKHLDWYFDVISPFAYLASTQLQRISPLASIKPVPVVFAGLLQHFGNIGPAEIAPKRQWTFEHCAWTAHQLGVPLNPPAAHPFNPVPLLRAVLAAGGDLAATHAAFQYVWVEGGDPSNAAAIAERLNTTPKAINTPAIKAQLIANGQAAIANGVFGVPTAVVDGHCFWGLDGMDMLVAYLQNDAWFQTTAYSAVKDFPQGVQRVVR